MNVPPTHEIAQKLLALPKEIADAERQVLLSSDNVIGWEDVLARNEAAHTHRVLSQVNPDSGKPLYTNADQRDAAIKTALAEDDKHQQALTRLIEVKNSLAHAKIARDELTNTMQVYTTLLRYFGRSAE